MPCRGRNNPIASCWRVGSPGSVGSVGFVGVSAAVHVAVHVVVVVVVVVAAATAVHVVVVVVVVPKRRRRRFVRGELAMVGVAAPATEKET